MRTRAVVALAALAALAAPAALAAQVCEGILGFRSDPLQFRAGAEFLNHQTTLTGGVGVGGPGRPWADVRGSYTSTDIAGGQGFGLRGMVGLPVGVRTENVLLCPHVAAGATFGHVGPSGARVNETSYQLRAGASLGLPYLASPSVTMFPAVSLDIYRVGVHLSSDAGAVSGSDTGGLLRLGAGFLLASRFTLTPAINLPFSLAGQDPTISIDFAVGLGRKRQP